MQSGLNENWADAAPICETNKILLWNKLRTAIRRTISNDQMSVPFGSLVEYDTISARDQSRIHQFRKKVLRGIFRDPLHAAGIWKGDMTVADVEELETMDALEIYAKRLNAKEVVFPKENGNFTFPVADGRIKLLGGDLDLRTPTVIRDHPMRRR